VERAGYIFSSFDSRYSPYLQLLFATSSSRSC
jgi:hypothetical protein